MKIKSLILIIGIILISLSFVNAQTGCCFDPDTGLCQDGSTTTECQDFHGEWYTNCDVTKCMEGCCVLGTGVDFVTQRRCELSARTLGVEFNWQAGISRENCLEIAESQEKGACVYGGEYEQGCTFSILSGCNGEFHPGLLCTAPQLNTICEKTSDTTCIDDKNEVYFVDSCGNTANIYDSGKINNEDYWTFVRTGSESCNPNEGNIESTSCGNCDYEKGSTCSAKTLTLAPDYGNYICKNLNCENGKKNGEEWCENENSEMVGSRHIRKFCLNGVIHEDPCGDLRTEYCDSGVCRSNPGVLCASAGNDSEACSDIDGCYMYEGPEGMGLDLCVPAIEGGLSFWEIGSTETSACSAASFEKEIEFRRSDSHSDWYVIKNIPNKAAFSTGGWSGDGGRWCTTSNQLYSSYVDSYSGDDGCNYISTTFALTANPTPRVTSVGGSAPLDRSFVKFMKNRCNAIGDCQAKFNYIEPRPGIIDELAKKNWIGDEGSLPGVSVPGKEVDSGSDLIKFFLLIQGSEIVGRRDPHDAVFRVPCKKTHDSDFGHDQVTCYIKFQCKSWKAGESGFCETCGEDGIPCTEYRCKALGRDCEYNTPSGADKGYCKKSSDVTPPKIFPLTGFITENYTYASITPKGFSINPDIKPNTAIDFGIKTDEESLCKFDVGTSDNVFSDMKNDFGETWGKEHKLRLSLPGQKALENTNTSEYSIIAGEEGEYSIYIRCEDGAGKWNIDPFTVKIRVDPKPDTIETIITNFNPVSGYRIKHNTTEKEISFSIDAPSECNWDTRDIKYDLMENNFSCDLEVTDLGLLNGYKCSGTLTNVTLNISSQTKYYIRCKDQPWLEGKEDDLYYRNINQESKEFILKASDFFEIIELTPNREVIKTRADTSVDLRTITHGGCCKGKSVCVWKIDKSPYTFFFNTNSSIHSQILVNRSEGKYNVSVVCEDEGENIATKSEQFSVRIDRDGPKIARAYYFADKLKVVTDENSICKFSTNSREKCNFDFENQNTSVMSGSGKIHTSDWDDDEKLYIKCRDFYSNENPDCVMVIRTY